MTVQTLTVGRQRFVLLKEKDYRQLRAKAEAQTVRKSRRADAQERGDLAEHCRRLAEPGGTPLEKVRERLGL